MAKHRHVLLTARGDKREYTSPRQGGGTFRTPPRDRRVHARKLLEDIAATKRDAAQLEAQTGHKIHDICLDVVSERDYELKLDSLEDRPSGIEVLSARHCAGTLRATVYVPEGQLEKFVRKVDDYEKHQSKKGCPRNEKLIAPIASIRFPVLQSFWTDDDDLFPKTETEKIWWEVWIQVRAEEKPDWAFTEFTTATADAEIQFSSQVIKFPERLVFWAHASTTDWVRVFVPVLDRLAELRRAKEIPTDFLKLPPREQGEYLAELAQRIVPPKPDAPAVCLLDFGIHAAHPLLAPLTDSKDVQAFDASWGPVDQETHGSEMAGLVAFGCQLPELLLGKQTHVASYRLESVRMLHTGRPHPKEAWGYVTQACLSKAESRAPTRRRVACLPVTADDAGRDRGRPSSWSAAIDQHAAGQLDGQQRLYIVSAGNIRDILTRPNYAYPITNMQQHGIEDPGQSWNALTVGATTDRIQIRSPEFAGFQPLAARPGGLCPTSRTSNPWESDWPVKPDIVMEGGNYARSSSGTIEACDDLALLTTTMDATGRLLTWMSDTSAATALAARFAAILTADYPELWPETIRGLMVHSANWTDEMCRQVPGNLEPDRHRRLRCFGYGVPELNIARYTVENCVSLVYQGHIQPFREDEGTVKTNKFVRHLLPWPKDALRQLHNQDVTVRITLSYFVEPSPAGRGWGNKFRYASHLLRFALRGPTESELGFLRRISRQEWDKNVKSHPPTSDPIAWEIGRVRTRGSIHSDWWTAPAADVAQCGEVAVYPVTGWWRERKHLGQAENSARYALIITISTPATDVDLYTPIAQQIGLVGEIGT